MAGYISINSLGLFVYCQGTELLADGQGPRESELPTGPVSAFVPRWWQFCVRVGGNIGSTAKPVASHHQGAQNHLVYLFWSLLTPILISSGGGLRICILINTPFDSYAEY